MSLQVRHLPALVVTALLALSAQAATPDQITLTTEQIKNAGIETLPAASTTSGSGGTVLAGTVVAPTNAITVVSAVVSGVVRQIHVQSLQQVQAGTPVATLFSQPLMEMQRDYLHLAIAARLAQDKLARDENLLKEGIIALSRVQDSRGAAQQAGIAAKERHQALRAAGVSDAAIRALVSSNTLSPTVTVVAGVRGTLQEITMTPGQRIEAGMPLATVSKDGARWIEFQASRQQAALIRTGDMLQLAHCGSAKVIAISGQITSANQSTLVRAVPTVSDDCLKLNEFIEATHQGAAGAAGIRVPAGAIVRHGDAAFVFVRNAAGFAAVKVVVAAGGADPVAVTGKLVAGNPVAVKGLVALKGAWIGLGADGAP
ncbi:putative Co/Zn/Cd efflux system membrane fusion protein [Oxalobacteraceae bacterium IMCC9480]|nr:putative Co/Zn/Cd efflux system membrane fusion protein [Oxalobacteraceae bacterium IMCC9480]NDP59984.1 efflux RND transporter periplasmic adaptor subunit [Oxalobacteraceae bacterium]